MSLFTRHPCPLALACASVIATGVALEPAAFAQGSYQSSPLGGRSVLLGGTGIALGVDGASPFLNPATLAKIEDTNVAFSSKFFRYTRRTVERWDQPGAIDPKLFKGLDLGDTSATQSQLATIPDSTCFFFSGKPSAKKAPGGALAPRSHTITFCAGKVEENGFSVSAEPYAGTSGSMRISRSRSRSDLWSRWSAGPSWSHGLSPSLAVGASVQVVRSYYERSMNMATIAEDTQSQSATTSTYMAAAEGSSWDVLALAGLTYKLNDVITLGLSVRSPSAHLDDDISATYSAGSTIGSDSGGTNAWEATGSFVARSPARIAAGVAAEWTRLRVELDAFVYPGMNAVARADLERRDVSVAPSGSTRRTSSAYSLVEEAKTIVNVGVGFEIFLTPKFSLLFGVLTDFTATPAFTGGEAAPDRLFMERKDAVHASLGVVAYTDYGDLIAGVTGTGGAGQMRAVNDFVSPPRLDPVYYSEIGGMFVLAGRLSLRSLTGAVRSIEDAVEAPSPVDKPTEPMRTPTKKE